MNILIESLYERTVEEINLINFELKELKKLSKDIDKFLFDKTTAISRIDVKTQNARDLLKELGEKMKECTRDLDV